MVRLRDTMQHYPTCTNNPHTSHASRVTGGEPVLLRRALGEALPNAPGPEAQMVKESAMLHTTLARLLLPPTGLKEWGLGAGAEKQLGGVHGVASGEDGGGSGRRSLEEKSEGVDAERVISAVQALSDALCGLTATFRCAWLRMHASTLPWHTCMLPQALPLSPGA